MKISSVVLFTVVLVVSVAPAASAGEKIDRGLVALERPDGSIFLSWRLLADDPADIAFEVRRNDTRLFITLPTCCVDGSAERGKTYTYQLFRMGELEPLAAVTIQLTGAPKPYIRIPLAGDYDFQKVGIADLDGDGVYEYLIKQPNFNTDPYQQPGYWKRSTTTYKIEAYKADGTMLWQYDMGWSIEAGIWYSPWIVYDLDGDGRAEVYCKAGEGDPRDDNGLVTSGPEYLVKLDGLTGKVLAKCDWLTRDGYEDYNRSQRNFLSIAYLDGKTPSLIVQRGTYSLIKVLALDKDLQKIWYWESTQEQKKYSGQSSHNPLTADVDGDGKDELVIGGAVIDDDGKGLWTLEMGHPDYVYVADIDADNPGLEIYYGFETRQKAGGLCVVDAATGRKLWTHKEPTVHIHGQGMAADILAEHPGIECWGGERDLKQRWLYSAKGELLEFHETGPLAPRALWWDDDPQKEVVLSGAIRKWGKDPIQKLEGNLIAVVDCIGDWREEAIVSVKGEIRIYTTTIPTQERRVCLMQNHQYRMGVASQTMGYYCPPQLGK
ncbi:MAG: silent information regulator protein Sir2 [Phycisphaerae bacterium]|nr:silent information regulator protein Sir2 [Phycisphaerae bacterium]